jgi:N-acetylglucosamine-6-phosphate deacetylase
MSSFELHCEQLFDGWGLQRQQRLTVDLGRVSRLQAAPAGATLRHIPAGYVVSPGLVDIQVNGGGGVLFNDAPTPELIGQLVLAHALRGTTSLLPTLITDDLTKVDQAIAAVRECLTQGMRGVLGIHLEGPFLSPRRPGIHQPGLMYQTLDVKQVCALGSLGKTLITLAPECVSASQIQALNQAGVLVFAGHTDCDDATFAAAVQAGLSGVTHLFNAMTQLGPRQVGVVGATLLNPKLWAGIILDGHHVGAPSFELVKRMGRLERTLLVSDAMPPSGTSMTSFKLQGQDIYVVDGRCVNAQGVLAGACVTLSDCVRIGIEQYGLTLEQALSAASRMPATLLGIEARKGVLRVGADADLVVWDTKHAVAGVMRCGQWIFVREDLQAHVGTAATVVEGEL